MSDIEWYYCPECGSLESTPSGSIKGFCCSDCGQEWFSDIDYTGIVRYKLNRLKQLERDLK